VVVIDPGLPTVALTAISEACVTAESRQFLVNLPNLATRPRSVFCDEIPPVLGRPRGFWKG
jgi:hypothetical protein